MIQQFFSENLPAIEMKRTHIILNKPVYLGLSILEMSKIVMCEFGYGYVKPKHGELQAKLYYMDTYRFIVFMKTKKKLRRYCKRCCNKIWYFELWIWQTITYRKNWKKIWINEIWIRCKNNDIICRIETKNMFLFNRW